MNASRNNRFYLAAQLGAGLLLVTSLSIGAIASTSAAATVVSTNSQPARGDELGLTQSAQAPTATMPEIDAALDAAQDARMRELSARRPSFTLIRLDPAGQPHVRMDLYFGGGLPETREELLALGNQFQFDGDSGTEQSSQVDGGDLPDWRTVILLGGSMPYGAPEMTSFRPDEDLVIAFRPAVLAISCSMSWPIQFHGYDHSGVSHNFYINTADAVTFVAQARRDTNANPNLVLYRWNGSTWVSVQSSIQGAWMDLVGSYHTGCGSNNYRVKVYMANEGYYSCIGVKFNAN